MDYLVFSLSEDRYAIPVSQVREVLDKATSLNPRSFHPSFAGSVEYRGTDVPAYDLRKRLDYPTAEEGGHGALILADTGAAGRFRIMALLVDDVSDVIDVDLRRISDLPGFGKGEKSSPCRRIIEDGDSPILVLDATFLADNEDIKALETLGETLKARPGSGV